MSNFNQLPGTTHCPLVKAIISIVSGDGETERRFFEQVCTSITSEFDTACKSLSQRQDDSSLVVRVINAVEMFSGLAQAANFSCGTLL